MSEKDSNKKSKLQLNKIYYIYIIKCIDEVLYTGITTDYKRRFNEHVNATINKKGAKFTRFHKPKSIVALWTTKTRSEASKLEIRIKQLSRDEKDKLINDNTYFKEFFATLVDCRKFRRLKISL